MFWLHQHSSWNGQIQNHNKSREKLAIGPMPITPPLLLPIYIYNYMDSDRSQPLTILQASIHLHRHSHQHLHRYRHLPSHVYIYIHILLHIIARLLLHLRLPLRLPQLHIGCISPIMFTIAGVSESVAQTIESMTCIVMNDAELRQNPGTLAASARTTTRRTIRTDHATVRRSTHQWRDSNRNRPESSSARHVRSGSSVHHQIGDNRTPAVLAQSTSYIIGWISPGTKRSHRRRLQ